MSDETIMQEAKDGDLSGLRLLFDRYNVALYNFFRKMGVDKELSEDLTQDLFYRIIKYRSSYNINVGSFKSWIYQMARNIFYDNVQFKQKTKNLIQHTDNYDFQLSQISDTGSIKTADESLDFALSKLSADSRELIVLSRYAGFKYSEIAKMKNTSAGAIKTQACRAMKELKDIYFKAAKI